MRPARLLLPVWLLVPLVSTLPGPAAYADDAGKDIDCSAVTDDGTTTGPLHTSLPSKPDDAMNVEAAWQFLRQYGHQKNPGQGVTVAVLDSGVRTDGTGIPVVDRAAAGTNLVRWYHGTDVAGLIAGPPAADGTPIGVAPGAQIYDVQVYDDPTATSADQGVAITDDHVVEGMQDVLDNAARLHIKVLTVALALPASDAVQSMVQQLWDAGVITVASSGNRPTGDETGGPLASYSAFHPGEDASADVHPAGYPPALSVGTSMTGLAPGSSPQAHVLQNSGISVVAPTAGGVSYSVLGGTCLNVDPATSWGAAEVSGVLALTQSYFHESPARAVSRLRYTANGSPAAPNDLLGAGEVQPYEALTRPLQMDADGRVLNSPVAQSGQQVLKPPTTPPDVLASTRHNAVWWGLVGGGALVLALLLRPVLARRRPAGRAADRR